MTNILFVFGTRPEAIKLAPLILELRTRSRFGVTVCVTGQHREMLDQVLRLFEIVPEHDLGIMKPNQDLTDIVASSLVALRSLLRSERFDRIIVQGDTTTTFAASLAAFYARIPVAHVEAGLRTGNYSAPWPEELNRVLTSAIADLHFAPTTRAKANLIREGVSPEAIHVTGNTVIDALLAIRSRLGLDADLTSRIELEFAFIPCEATVILVTGHRRESFGPAFEEFCSALREIVEENPDIHLVYPVHLNPNVREPVYRILGASGEVEGRIHLIPPIDYVPFVYLMSRARFIITDSGGVQEEAPSLGKPVLVTRDTTERPEAVEAGTVIMVGTTRERIVGEAQRLLRDPDHYAKMSRAHNPYGDGEASRRIATILEKELQ